MAFRNTGAYTKILNDVNGVSITGWETMNIPARWRVEDMRISIANFPARNFAPATTGTPAVPVTRFWKVAVAYPSSDYFRLAYYVKEEGTEK
jgi:hypothetical protein